MTEKNIAASEIADSIVAAFDKATINNDPFKLWSLEKVLPSDTVKQILELPFEPQDVGDVSGSREINNNTRSFFNRDNRIILDICQNVAGAFQRRTVIDIIEKVCDIDLTGSFLRIEYAQDKSSFWLEPHTDIKEKKFTMQLYLSKLPSHSKLGTDLYEEHIMDSDDTIKTTWAATTPFKSNNAIVFIPSNDTWHGFERKKIYGVRKSLIINYVADWQARRELCFPDKGEI